MSTSGIGAARLVLTDYQTTGVQSTSKTGSDSTQSLADLLNTQTTGATGQAATTDISGPAKLISKLNQLKTSDPEKYKQTVGDIATKLQDAADKATGDDAKVLSTLASKFKDAADGKDLNLDPPGGFGKGGPPRNAQALYGQSSSTTDGTQAAFSGQKSHHHSHRSGAAQSTIKGIFDDLSKTLDAAGTTDSTATTGASA